jgi:tetratricopeptide (TPR) repeat protein
VAARAVCRYARGIALAVLGRVDVAQAELDAFRGARAEVPESRMLFQNSVDEILGVADHVLEGEIEYRRGNYERAFELLRKAAELDESLSYDEPWGWMEPVRHALGALLLEQGHYEQALEVYREDLARFPENGWALHGMAECLEELGRHVEAVAVRTRFKDAWMEADVAIPGSCFCRTGG